MVIGVVGFAQAPRLRRPKLLSSGGVEATLEGSSDRIHRVDVSTNLIEWSPIQILGATNPIKAFRDPSPQTAARFYRAVEIPPGLRILRVSPGVGQSGDVVAIDGHFFVNTGAPTWRASVGGVDAEVLSAGPTHIEIRVPEGARTGPIQLGDRFGSVSSPQDFTALETVTARIEPQLGDPSKLAPRAFTSVCGFDG